MDKKEIVDKLTIAIKMLFLNDSWLIFKDLSERSITHKLAEYLQSQFSEYNVDCEYNGNEERGEGGRKRISVLKEDLEKLGLLKEKEISDFNTDFIDRSVFPDIIVHKRGTNDNNLCIVEVKKSTSSVSSNYDEIKLKAYTTAYYGNDLRYSIGFFIEFITGTQDLKYVLKYFVNGAETNGSINTIQYNG